jgi:AraC-like DNA-binding protein
MRLTQALDHARTGATLVDVAVSAGYFDQAHLCREVRDLTGSTPAELLVHLGIK